MRIKILLLFAIIFCVVVTTNAQINKGMYFIGGSFNLYHSKTNINIPPSLTESLYANIQLGKVIKDNTIAGLILSYNYFNYSNNSYPGKNNTYSAGIFYRKYKRLSKDFYLWGEADATYDYSENKQGIFQNGSDGSKMISNGGILSFIPGMSYKLCRRMQIELLIPNVVSFGYGHQKTDYTSSTATAPIPSQKTNTFSVVTNLNSNLLSSFGIGFKFLLGKPGNI